MARLSLIWLALVTLGACHQQVAPPSDVAPSAITIPQAVDADSRSYILDTDRSQVDVVVRREGPLARFGHDHVISTRKADGYLLLHKDITQSRAELQFLLLELEVDQRDARQVYHLDTEPDADDIEATRHRLLTEVLESEQWPALHIAFSNFDHQASSWSADTAWTVNGVTSSRRMHFALNKSGNQLVISGQAVLRQTELGLEPFSALGGGLRVADELEIHFSLYAQLHSR